MFPSRSHARYFEIAPFWMELTIVVKWSCASSVLGMRPACPGTLSLIHI